MVTKNFTTDWLGSEDDNFSLEKIFHVQLSLLKTFPFFWIRRIDCYFVIGEKNGKQFIDEIHILFENITNAAASDAADVGFRPTSRIPLQASSLAWFAGNGFKMEKRSTLQEVYPNLGVSSNKLSFFKLRKPNNYQLRTLILGTVIHQQTEIS